MELVRRADTAAFIQCQLNAFEYLGGVPRRCLYDNAKVITLGRDEEKRPVWNERMLDFALRVGFELRLCQPYRFMQYAKGALEMAVAYHTGTPPKARYNPLTAIAKRVTESPDITPEKRYDLVRRKAAEAIGHALDAAFWATGKASPNRISLEQKATLVAEALPQESLTTRLPLATYQETETPLALSREDFTEAAVADTGIYREAAKRARRRTASQSKKALREWQQEQRTSPSTPK